MSQDPNFNRPMDQPYKSPVINNGAKPSGTSGKAIASLVLGLLSIVGMCLTGIPGLILGIMGLGDINRSAGRIGGKGVAIFGIVLSSLGILWTTMAPLLLIGMMLPAVQQVREVARRATSSNNMRQQSLAMLNYESAYLKFPPREENGLSWRVHLLPFIERSDLHSRFHLDEPWDSPHNIQLLDEMPEVYACPSVVLPPGYTVYQVPYTDVTKNPAPKDLAMFDTSGKFVTFNSVTDGISNTAILLEVDAAAAVEWTKPADWEYDPSDPKRDLGNVHPGIILVNFADSSNESIPNSISFEDMKAIITRTGGEAQPPFVNY